MNYATKGGKCTSTMARGHLVGQIIHAVPGTIANGFWGTTALCGAKPGIRGYGWLESDAAIATCPKCLKKAVKLDKFEQELISLIAERNGWCWSALIECNFQHSILVVRSLQSKGLIKQAEQDDQAGFALTAEGQKLLQEQK